MACTLRVLLMTDYLTQLSHLLNKHTTRKCDVFAEKEDQLIDVN